MAVLSCDRNTDGKTGKLEKRGSGSKRVRNYTELWTIISDSDDDEQLQILTHSELPDIDESHITDDFSFCKSKSAVRNDDAIKIDGGGRGWKWVITCEYSSDFTPYTSPLYPDTPAVIGYSFDRKEVPVYKDRDGAAIVNTAKDPYSPPVVVEFPIPVKTIQVNLAEGDFSASTLLMYFMAINSGAYDGFGAKQAMIQDIQAQQTSYTDDDDEVITYWAVTIKIAFNAFGWQPEIMSQGYRQIVSGTKKEILIEGKPVTTPLPLNNAGAAVTGTDVSTAAFKTYKIFNEISFGSLVY